MPASKPHRMTISFETIPAELRASDSWVVWAWKLRGPKWDKPLYQVSGNFASSINPKTWSTYAQVMTAYHAGRFDGIGYVFTAGDSFVGIDWDKCRNPDTGQVDAELLSQIKALNTYTEVSPSGSGFKSICRGHLPAKGHHNEQIGVFGKGRYFCITGNIFSQVVPHIMERQIELNALIKRYWPNDFKQKESKPFTAFNHTLPDSDIIKKALNSKDSKFHRLWSGDISGYTSHSEADQALCNKLAFWAGKDFAVIDTLFRQSGLNREKWEKREDYREKTIQNAIDSTQECYRPRIIIKSISKSRKPYEKFRNFFN